MAHGPQLSLSVRPIIVLKGKDEEHRVMLVGGVIHGVL
jgi:hypothetical protein